jgi:hypothetical protein
LPLSIQYFPQGRPILRRSRLNHPAFPIRSLYLLRQYECGCCRSCDRNFKCINIKQFSTTTFCTVVWRRAP